jgi:hypothetical protein
MDLPKIKRQQKFEPSRPDLFLWEDKNIGIYTPRLSFMFPGEAEGAVALLFEEAQFRAEKNFYVPVFDIFTDAGEVLDRVQELQKIYFVKNTYARRTKSETDFIAFRNRGASRYLHVLDPPNVDKVSGIFTYHLNLLRDLLRPGRERIFFSAGSDIPRLLSSLPVLIGAVKDGEHRAVSCLCYGVAGLIHNETNESAGDTSRAKTDYDVLNHGLN